MLVIERTLILSSNVSQQHSKSTFTSISKYCEILPQVEVPQRVPTPPVGGAAAMVVSPPKVYPIQLYNATIFVYYVS